MSHGAAPVPSLAPGESVVVTEQDCLDDKDTTGTTIVGHHCSAKTYAVMPAEPVATSQETTYVCQGPAAPDGTCGATLHPQQFTSLGFGLALVVLLLAALVVAQLRRPRAA